MMRIDASGERRSLSKRVARRSTIDAKPYLAYLKKKYGTPVAA
jgi:hypothetical protein